MDRLIDLTPSVKYMGETLREIAMGFERAQILFTAFELGIFTKLEKPLTPKALIQEMTLNPETTARFLDVLTAMNLISKNGEQYQTHPDFVPFLVEGEPYYSLYLESALKERKMWMDLKKALVEDTLLSSEKTKFAYNPDSLKWTARDCTHGRLQRTLKIVSSLPEFKKARNLIDLGGGHGLFGIGFAQENLDLRVVIFDQPHITEISREYVGKYDLCERVKVLSGDYLQDDFGKGYDIIFEALSLEGGPEEAKALYQKVSHALNPNGLFITQLFTLDDSEISPLPTLILDLRERIKDYQQMHLMTNAAIFESFKKVGLFGEQIIDMSMGANLPMKMIIARKTSNMV
ncbi:methyltransferase dimerization domain-containing protein [Methanomethylovorans sp.]|uniref:methyltransferase family protein n=1 Tax=Methanomethylovorans sp. TaxID=2758717 RepID=UPI00351C4DEA